MTLKARRAFTLVEMLVVVTICLFLLLLIVPIFKVVTSTVRHVEERLDVYEAARNVLDNMELEIQQAIQNERGEIFAIKNVAFTAKTSPDLDPFCKPGVNPDGSAKYFWNERSADAVNFAKVRMQANYYQGANYRYPLDFPHATTHDFWVNSIEVYEASLASNLLYLDPRWVSRDYNRLNDVRQIAVDLHEAGRMGSYYDDPAPPAGSGQRHLISEPPDFLSPWKGNIAPWNTSNDRSNWVPLIYGTPMNSIAQMDFDVAYWDDLEKIWREPPQDTEIFFRDMPKAIRLTICVCDYKKATRLVLCRIVHLPCGNGTGELDAPFQPINSSTPPDNVFIDAASNVSIYGRPKNLLTLDPYAKDIPKTGP